MSKEKKARDAVEDTWALARTTIELPESGEITAPPKVVDLVCLGHSAEEYRAFCMRKTPQGIKEADELWTLNRGGRLYAHDLLFVMDDLVGEHTQDPDYGAWLKGHRCITSTEYRAAYPLAHAYPIHPILEVLSPHHHYFHNSVPYILCFAFFLGVKEIRLWGADYSTPDGRTMEDSRANVEYWVGVLRERGMTIAVPTSSTLLNVAQHPGGWWYGYKGGVIPERQPKHSDAGAVVGLATTRPAGPS